LERLLCEQQKNRIEKDVQDMQDEEEYLPCSALTRDIRTRKSTED